MLRILAQALFATATAATVVDSLPSVPQGWTQVRQAQPDESISLRIALHQQHAEALEQAVLEMSTPGHPNYGMHMTRDEVRQYTAPSQQATSAVLNWLNKNNVPQSHADNDWINFQTTVANANDLLNTTFAWYQYSAGGGPKLRTLEYSIPDELVGHVDLIQPTTRFGQLGAKRSTIFDMQILEPVGEEADVHVDAAASACGTTVTPACIKDQYKIGYTPKATGNLVAFASYLEEYARYTDLQSFETAYVPGAKGQNFTVELVNGGLNNQGSSDDSGEANLDIQYILGVSHPIPIREYSTGGRGPLVPTKDEPGPTSDNEPYLEFLTYILAQDDANLPQTLSTSYGEEEQSVPEEYALKVCNMFMQLGARGVSVLFSSGDSGPGTSCVRASDNAPFFQPSFPAGCPYVTAVGATTGSSPERGVSFSSGGFSIYHDQPAYQSSVVNTYLSSIGSTYSAYFNKTGRGFPDVAAQGSAFYVIDKGSRALLSGTSASSPTFAGVVALLNAARKEAGLSSLGFLNPWLYNNTATLTDITAGFSSGCGGKARWNATAGWDPVTGLGTPAFDKMLAVAAPGVANS